MDAADVNKLIDWLRSECADRALSLDLTESDAERLAAARKDVAWFGRRLVCELAAIEDDHRGLARMCLWRALAAAAEIGNLAGRSDSATKFVNREKTARGRSASANRQQEQDRKRILRLAVEPEVGAVDPLKVVLRRVNPRITIHGQDEIVEKTLGRWLDRLAAERGIPRPKKKKRTR